MRPSASRGSAFVNVLILMAFVVPLVLLFLKSAARQNKSALQERQIKESRALTTNVMVDFMRQFSQNQTASYLDASALARPETYSGAGFSDVTTEVNALGHFIYFRSTGRYGRSGAASKHLDAVIRFAADLTRFGNLFNNTITISASGPTYNGGFYVNGNLTVTGANATFNSGPVVVKGNLTVPGSAVFNTDVYVDGATAFNGATVNGVVYRYVPDVDWPSIDTTYYSLHNHYTIDGTSQTWVFSVQTSTQGIFTVQGTTVVVKIPSTGGVFFANNTNVTIRGTVRGRVTVVVAGPALSATAGNLRVNGSLVYANGTNTASAQDSFAALASNNIQIDCTIDPPPQAPNNTHFTVLNGVFSSVNSGQVNMVNATGGGFAGLKFYGTRTNLFTLTAGGGTWTPSEFYYDANLVKYAPPGLPEKPKLVTWRTSN